MELDANRYFHALKSRDARFDGRFFLGVTSTGIYCRPICPASTPKRENIRFFACAAAAEEAGFRPCRRCRPETSPGTPAWIGSSATVTRALRFIAEGELDNSDVESLAARLGIGERQLRRLFRDHLGTTPVVVAQTRRLHFARKLIDETSLPMTRVALHSGFSSIRRFNDAIKRAFGHAPRDLRRLGAKKAMPSRNGDLILHLPYRPPYDWDALAGFLKERAIHGIEVVETDRYLRTIDLPDARGMLEVRPLDGESALRLRLDVTNLGQLSVIVERARRLFDLGADPLPIERQFTNDPVLSPAVRRRPGLRLPGAWDAFELAVRAVLGQQVSVRGASTLAGRLVREFGRRIHVPSEPQLTHVFPRPKVLARADLTRIGLTRSRSETIRSLAGAIAKGRLDLTGAPDPADTIEELQQIPGIGEWTAQYIAMRALGEPDAFPAGDLGLRKALIPKRRDRHATSRKPLSRTDVIKIAEPWRPWRAYAAMHLWMTLSSHESGGR